jgi:lipoate-protein ligase B
VTTELGAFEVINPCGLDRPVTSMAAVLGRLVQIDAVRRAYAAHFASRFQRDLRPMTRDAVARAIASAPVA